jgi:hypothetical protein
MARKWSNSQYIKLIHTIADVCSRILGNSSYQNTNNVVVNGFFNTNPRKRHQKLMFLSSDYGDGVQSNMFGFKLQSKIENLSTNKRMTIGIIEINRKTIASLGWITLCQFE